MASPLITLSDTFLTTAAISMSRGERGLHEAEFSSLSSFFRSLQTGIMTDKGGYREKRNKFTL